MHTPTFQQVRHHLVSMGVEPGSPPIPLRTYARLTEHTRNLFGQEALQFLLDCFMPEGEPVAPGYEESLSHYVFQPQSWEELQKEWEEVFSKPS